MATQQFDVNFQELYTKLVDIGFEYVNRNQAEVDEVFIYADLEGGFFYNVFYRINGELVKNHKINQFSKMQYDISKERQMKVLGKGGEYLRTISRLFSDDQREIPTRMKMIYNPKTGSFNNDISYNKEHDNKALRGNVELFNEWYTEMGGKL